MRFGIYAGNMGFGHSFQELFHVVDSLFSNGRIDHFYFIGKGKKLAEVKSLVMISPFSDRYSILGFLPEEEFQAYTKEALFHAIVLRPEATGVMVPSKFYTSIESGKPVLYYGRQDSELAMDIKEYGLGVTFLNELPNLDKEMDWAAMSRNCEAYTKEVNNGEIAARRILSALSELV